MDVSSASAIVRDDLVTADVACVQCGYNLRTLSVDARCPECGESVGDSVAAAMHELRGTTKHAWLSNNAWAMVLLGCAAALIWIVLAVLPWVRTPETPPRDVALMMMVIGWTLQWVAVWKLCSPLVGEHRVYRAARSVALVGSTVLLFVPICFGIAGIVEYWAPVNTTLIRFLMSAGAVIGLVGWLAVSVLLVRLARTLGRPRLARFVVFAAVSHLVAGGLSIGGVRTMAVTKPVGTSMDVMLTLVHPLLGSPGVTRQLVTNPLELAIAAPWGEQVLAIDQVLLLIMWMLVARAIVQTQRKG